MKQIKKELAIIIKLLFPEAFIERIRYDPETNDWNIYTCEISDFEIRYNAYRKKYRDYLIQEFGINHVFFVSYETIMQYYYEDTKNINLEYSHLSLSFDKKWTEKDEEDFEQTLEELSQFQHRRYLEQIFHLHK